MMLASTVTDRLQEALRSFRHVAVYQGASCREALSLASRAIYLDRLDDLTNFCNREDLDPTQTGLLVFDDLGAKGNQTASLGLETLLDTSRAQVECFDRLLQRGGSVLHIESSWLALHRDAPVPMRVDAYLDDLWKLVSDVMVVDLVWPSNRLRARVNCWTIERCFDRQPGINQWPGGEVFAEIRAAWTGPLPILYSTPHGRFRSGTLSFLDGFVVRIEDEDRRSISDKSHLIGRRVTEIGLGGNPLITCEPTRWSEKLHGSLHLGLGMSTSCEMSPPWCHSDILVCLKTAYRRGRDDSIEISLL